MCVYIYIYMCIDVYIYTYMHACMHACMHAYIHTYTRVQPRLRMFHFDAEVRVRSRFRTHSTCDAADFAVLNLAINHSARRRDVYGVLR